MVRSSGKQIRVRESVMKHFPSQSKRSLDFDHRLSMYALAASAAGVGMLALAQSAEGKIIYTKAHRTISPNTTIKLDLNHDGIVDFSLKDTFSQSFYSSWGRLIALPAGQKNQVWGHAVSRRGYASALLGGVRVGAKGQFLAGSGVMASTYFLGGRNQPPFSASCHDPWANVTNRYLGLKFVITGKMHFGWARLNVSCASSHVNATLTGYAYETVPNRPIFTGKQKGPGEIPSFSRLGPSPRSPALHPVSLGRLAQGAAGSDAWRQAQEGKSSQ
jgi:hypothetical protein